MALRTLYVLLPLAFSVHAATRASGPGGYYDSIDKNLNGTAFQKELTALINKAKVLSYAQLWTAFLSTDDGVDPNGCPQGTIGVFCNAFSLFFGHMRA